MTEKEVQMEVLTYLGDKIKEKEREREEINTELEKTVLTINKVISNQDSPEAVKIIDEEFEHLEILAGYWEWKMDPESRPKRKEELQRIGARMNKLRMLKDFLVSGIIWPA